VTVTPPSVLTCTGIAASWCPVCGDCSCPYEVGIGRLNMDDRDCPLHAHDSLHADPVDNWWSNGPVVDFGSEPKAGGR
jgi:hypothetical protein